METMETSAEDLDVFSSEFNITFDDDTVSLSENPSPEEEILWLAQRGLIDRAERLLTDHPELVHCQDEDGYSPLHRACYSDRPDMVELLLSRKAPMDLATNEGWLPLHSACKWGNYSCALKLLMHGSPVNETSAGDREVLSVYRGYQAGAPSCRLYVKNLSKAVTERDLHFIFRAFLGHKQKDEEANQMFDIRLMQEGRMKGQAFVTFPSVSQAQSALQETNGYLLKEKPIVVQFARSAKPKTSTE